MFTKIKVWWMLRCFKNGIDKNQEMQKLKQRMESCIKEKKNG